MAESNNSLQIFQNEQFGKVRTMLVDGEPWFIAADVCKALEISNNRDALERLDADEKGVALTDTLGGKQKLATVNEMGLYTLILTSRKPDAKKFKRWITHDVIPTIRKTGGYVANEDTFINTYLPYADEPTKILFRSTLETVRSLNEKIKTDAPKVAYFDRAIERGDNLSFRDTAKVLGIQQKTFIDYLGTNNYIYRDQKGRLRPYTQYEQNGLFAVKEFEKETSGYASVQTLVTFKGRNYFSKKIPYAKNPQQVL